MFRISSKVRSQGTEIKQNPALERSWTPHFLGVKCDEGARQYGERLRPADTLVQAPSE
jgi:hypothetical protein